MTAFDDILEEADGFGRFQKRLFGLLCLVSVPFSGIYVGLVFQGFTPDHWCRDPGAREVRARCGDDLRGASGFTVPTVNSSGGPVRSQCERYAVNWTLTDPACNASDGQRGALPRIACDAGWEYDYEGRESYVTEVTIFTIIVQPGSTEE